CAPTGGQRMPDAGAFWTFGPFALDPAHACLWHNAEPVPLSPKVFDVLYYLVTHTDRVVTKDELLDAVWPDTAVTDAGVRVAIAALRKSLGEPRPPRFLSTVPRRGYRFVARVTRAATTPAGAPPAVLFPALPPLLVEREAVMQWLEAAW